MKRRRYVDIDLLSDALIKTNEKKLKRDYDFKINNDLSYKCPTCGKVFLPHRVKGYSKRANPHSRRHYNLIACQSRKANKQSYTIVDYRYHQRGKRNSAKHILTPVVNFILAFDKYKINELQILLYSIIQGGCSLYPKIKFYNPNYESCKRAAISMLSTSDIRRDIDIPMNTIKITNKLDYTFEKPVFNNISEIKPFIKSRIKTLLECNFRTKEELLYFQAFNPAAEAKRNIPDKLTEGMKEWIKLVDENHKPVLDKRVGLLTL